MAISKRTIFISLLLVCCTCQMTWGQNLSIDAYSSRVTVDTLDLSGFATTFNVPQSEVKNAWWKYIKKRAIIFNNITHYDLKIPADDEGNTDIFFISQLIEDTVKNVTTLKIALKEEVDNQDLQKQMKWLLEDFKSVYFASSIQKEVDVNEKKAKKLSKEFDRLDKLNQQLEARIEKKPGEGRERRAQIRKNETRQQEIRVELQQINESLDLLKAKLARIK